MVQRDTGPTHGVLYLPGKDLVVEAARGHGCRVNGELIQLRKGQVRIVLRSCLQLTDRIVATVSHTAGGEGHGIHAWVTRRVNTHHAPNLLAAVALDDQCRHATLCCMPKLLFGVVYWPLLAGFHPHSGSFVPFSLEPAGYPIEVDIPAHSWCVSSDRVSFESWR